VIDTFGDKNESIRSIHHSQYCEIKNDIPVSIPQQKNTFDTLKISPKIEKNQETRNDIAKPPPYQYLRSKSFGNEKKKEPGEVVIKLQTQYEHISSNDFKLSSPCFTNHNITVTSKTVTGSPTGQKCKGLFTDIV
tara:strand:- start:112 stop:516 length:405 start_codon:yes stop_codon:yes gene_type:complete